MKKIDLLLKTVKTGRDSLCVIIPKAVRKKLGLVRGQMVKVFLEPTEQIVPIMTREKDPNKSSEPYTFRPEQDQIIKTGEARIESVGSIDYEPKTEITKKELLADEYVDIQISDCTNSMKPKEEVPDKPDELILEPEEDDNGVVDLE